MIQANIPRPPYIKPKGFLHALTPIALYGIPKEADSKRDKNVIGTAKHSNFWENELYKIKNGITVSDGNGGKMWIPGRFYYYMNYKMMSTISGVIRPDMVDLHLELAYMIEWCLANGVNLLIPKARRKGISEAAHTMGVDYGIRFDESFQAGVAAGKKTYIEDFMTKWRFADSNLPSELQLKKLVDNDDEVLFGYNIKNEQGAFVEDGSRNAILTRTMHTNPNMFKGLFLKIVISEELGEHENWMEFLSATKDCFKDGNKQVGIMIAFGTGGNVDKGSKDFKEISYKAEEHNFIEFVITADRFLFYGGASQENKRIPLNSELFEKYKAYQLIGVEDLVSSRAFIEQQREKDLKSGNLKSYNENLQNNPLTKAEIFRKSVVNNFNIFKLNEQQAAIDSTHKKYSKFKLDWVKDKDNAIKIPYEVSLRPATDLDDESECVLIIDTELYRATHRNLYSAGCDSYDLDSSKTSKSLGAMCVLIRENAIGGAMKRSPVAVIRTRPKRKEIFYEMCLKLCVYYKLDGQFLVDVRTPGIIQYFKERGAERYLAVRPQKFEKVDSSLQHDFGVSLNAYSKPMMVSMMQDNIEDYVHNNWFPELINELGNYDEVEIGSDNDLADAYGIALMQDVSCEFRPKDNKDQGREDDFKFSWEKGQGSDRPRMLGDEQDLGLFGK